MSLTSAPARTASGTSRLFIFTAVAPEIFFENILFQMQFCSQGGNQENIYWSDKPGFIWDPIQILETRNLELSEWQYNSLMLHLHIKAEYGPPWNFTVPGGCLHLGWQCLLVLSTIKNLSIVRTLVNAFNKMAAFLGHCKISWSLVCTALLDIDHGRRCRGGNDDVDAALSIVM